MSDNVSYDQSNRMIELNKELEVLRCLEAGAKAEVKDVLERVSNIQSEAKVLLKRLSKAQSDLKEIRSQKNAVIAKMTLVTSEKDDGLDMY